MKLELVNLQEEKHVCAYPVGRVPQARHDQEQVWRPEQEMLERWVVQETQKPRHDASAKIRRAK